MNELHWIGSGSERTLILGLLPRISIDIRIRCPRTFSEEFPPPPPPTVRYVELASKAAQKILNALWFCRSYIEVIKVGYTLDAHSPNAVYITGEVVLVEPTGEKISAKKVAEIGSKFDRHGMTFELVGPEQAYENIIRLLADGLLQEIRMTVRRKTNELKRNIAELQRFQMSFADPADAE